LQYCNHRIDRVKQRLLILLQVLVVRTREALKGGHEARGVAQDTASLPPEKLECVGVFLLGHEGRAGGVGVRKADLWKRLKLSWVTAFIFAEREEGKGMGVLSSIFLSNVTSGWSVVICVIANDNHQRK